MDVVLVTLFALVIRLIIINQTIGLDCFPSYSDMYTYLQQGLGILDGTWPQPEPFYYHPLMSYLAAMTFKIFGVSTIALRLVTAVIGSLVCGVITLSISNLFGRRMGLATGVLMSVYSSLAYHSTVFTDVSTSSLTIAAILALLSAPNGVMAAVCGVIVAVGVLGRVTLLINVAMAAIFLTRQKKYGPMILFLSIVSFVVVLVVIRNGTYGQLAFTTNGPVNFWIGNNQNAVGLYSFTNTDNLPLSSNLWLEMALRDISADPLHWALLEVKKAAIFLILPDGTFAEQTSANSAFKMALFLRVLPSSTFFIIVALLFLIFREKFSRQGLLTYVAICYVPSFIAALVFFYEDRFRAPAMIGLILLTASLLCSMLNWIEAQYRRNS